MRSVAAVYLLKGGNRFKVIAYERAADAVEHLTAEVKDIWENGQLLQLSGIGPSILQHIDQYFKKPQGSHLMKIISQVPPAVFVLMKVPGLGPKKSYKLVKMLKLEKTDKSVDDLEKACREGKVASIESFGEKSQQDILQSINLYRKLSRRHERMYLPYAYGLASQVIDYLKKNPYVERVDALGSLRRMVSTIGDIDLAVVCRPKYTSQVIDHFVSYRQKLSVEEKGEKKAAIVSSAGKRIDLRVADRETYGSMFQYFTGSKEHNIKLREYALRKGYSLSEYGIKKIKSEKAKMEKNYSKSKIFKFRREKEFYRFLGLSYIPPEIREGGNEIELAKKKGLPRLVELSDIKGDFHLHSDFNLEPSHDLGSSSFEEIVKKARKLNYQYLALADHNPGIGNHTKEQIVALMKKRKKYFDVKIKNGKIDSINCFISLEADILPDGKVALPKEGLAYVDFLIVSVHSRFRMSKDKMTERILKALSYPKVKIIGHPTGRKFGTREQIDVDWEEVFRQCKARKIALEINSWPERLDLPDVLVKEAVERGVKLAVGSDAHQAAEMDNQFFGVAVARRGWAKKSDIINSWDYKKVNRWILS